MGLPVCYVRLYLVKSKNSPVQIRIRISTGKIIKGLLCRADNMLRDIGCALGSTILRVFQTALPLQHGPALIIIFCQGGKNTGEIDLAIARGTEAPRPVYPVLIAAVDAASAIGTKLRVFHMKGLDAFVINVDKSEIIQLLQLQLMYIALLTFWLT